MYSSLFPHPSHVVRCVTVGRDAILECSSITASFFPAEQTTGEASQAFVLRSIVFPRKRSEAFRLKILCEAMWDGLEPPLKQSPSIKVETLQFCVKHLFRTCGMNDDDRGNDRSREMTVTGVGCLATANQNQTVAKIHDRSYINISLYIYMDTNLGLTWLSWSNMHDPL